MTTSALLPSTHTCIRPRLSRASPVLQSSRQHSARCQSYRRRGDFGPGMSGFGPWADLLSTAANRTIPQILQEVERELQRANEEAGRYGQSKPYSGSQQPPSRAASPAAPGADMLLAVDSIETDDAYVFYADVPGLNKADLKLRINQQERTLTVSGERAKPEAASESDDASSSSATLERRYGSFNRELSLPESADLQAINAKVDKGVLRIRVLKEIKSSAAKEMEIPIE